MPVSTVPLLHWTQPGVLIATVATNGDTSGRTCDVEGKLAAIFAGHGLTSPDGHWQLDLSAAQCIDSSAEFLGEPTLVATALTNIPRVVTAKYQLTPTSLQIEIFSWLPGGGSVGNTPFSWYCIARYIPGLI